MSGKAVVVGSGPNGLAAAIRMAQEGFQVQVFEGAELPGGGARSGELTLPGVIHDFGSAIHPMALSSPFFSRLSLEKHGLEWVQPEIPLAHPLDSGGAAVLYRSIEETAAHFGPDADAYQRMVKPLVSHWNGLVSEVLKPLPSLPRYPLLMARFGLRALQPASWLSRSLFRTAGARAMFAGLAAHSFMRLDQWMSASFGLILAASGHAVGWPIPMGGSQSITNALLKVLAEHGGALHTGHWIRSLGDLPNHDVALFDVTPRQFLHIAAGRLEPAFRRALQRYRYGPGVYKMDWVLREPIPWRAQECRRAGTIHLGGSIEEIEASERAALGRVPSSKPFIILAQPSLFDPTRAHGKHTVWAYCHVPHGWTGSQASAIEQQIERFAPGFRDCLLARHISTPSDLERQNPNFVGGDISGGISDLRQFFLRPTLLQYRTSIGGVYLCSSSTPPSGGVHGMCGFNAAEKALRKWRSTRG